MAEECKFFLGESGQFKFVPSDSTLQDSSSQVEIKKDLLDLDYRKHMEPYISGQTPAAGSVVCYPDITTEAQVNTKKEFEELKTYEDSVIIPNKSFKESKKEANSCCNRYVNVLPYDDNYVKIKPTEFSTGYVNNKEEPLFIATQGPMHTILEDFWVMVYEHRTTHIVMLGNLVENGRPKVDQYWPVKRYVGYRVELTLLSEEKFSSEVIHRTLSLASKENLANIRVVHQYHYFGWPDHGVPPSADGLLRLISHIDKERAAKGDTSPIVTHCSAGIGRTGAYCAIDIALRSIRDQKAAAAAAGVVKPKLYFDLMYITKVLRNSRKGMIQQLDQYKYCYQAVLRCIELCAESQGLDLPEASLM